ncbi:MAG: hypothetical protein C0410_13695 [Anaerolinea sp.]|nr:hypothetical protein [Anaerolinea sp.]
MKNKDHIRPLETLLAMVLITLLLSITGCGKTCSTSELNSYIQQVQSIQMTIRDLNNESQNHPEQKMENTEKMRTIKTDFSKLSFPKCAKELNALVMTAMASSIEYLDPAEDNFYFTFQRAEIAFSSWKAVEEKISEVSDQYLD